MTAKEFHTTKIIPARQELARLEEEYRRLWKEDKARENGLEKIHCGNCAKSCVLDITDHNGCLGDSCTCCHSWCYQWMPETKVSAFLRKHYKYDIDLVYKLQDLCGDDFLKCDDTDMVFELVNMIKKIEEAAKQ